MRLDDILLSMRTENDFSQAYLENDFDRTLRREPATVVSRIADLFDLQDPNDAIGKMRTAIHAGKMPMIVVNHQSLADGPALSAITTQLKIGFNLPVAASIDVGLQGMLVQSVNSCIDPVLAQRNLFTVPIITGGDVEKREMVKGSTGLSELLKTAHSGRGFAMFPEATVTGGRTNGNGEINGLVKPSNPNVFTKWVERFAKQGADPVVLPVGIDGSYKIFDPNTYSFPNYILRMLVGYDQPKKIGTITLGNLIPFSEIGVGEQTDDFFMERIARLLPQHAHGAYRSEVK